jgi:hypothetical protein
MESNACPRVSCAPPCFNLRNCWSWLRMLSGRRLETCVEWHKNEVLNALWRHGTANLRNLPYGAKLSSRWLSARAKHTENWSDSSFEWTSLTLLVKFLVFWDVTPCDLVVRYQRSEKPITSIFRVEHFNNYEKLTLNCVMRNLIMHTVH